MSKTLLYGATKVDETNNAYAAAASLRQFQWRNRVLIVFADGDNARAARQENLLLGERGLLEKHDIVVLRIRGDAVSSVFGGGEGLNAEAIRRDLDGPEAGEFAMTLVGKDGTVKLRATEPLACDELFTIIDAMPMRAAETTQQI